MLITSLLLARKQKSSIWSFELDHPGILPKYYGDRLTSFNQKQKVLNPAKLDHPQAQEIIALQATEKTIFRLNCGAAEAWLTPALY